MKMKIFRQIIINFLRVAYAYTKLIQGPNMGPLLQSLEIFPQGSRLMPKTGTRLTTALYAVALTGLLSADFVATWPVLLPPRWSAAR
jgi:hypothetical protein